MSWVRSSRRDCPPARVAEALAGELRTMADWLGLSEVTVGRRGDLASALPAAQGR